MWSMWCSSALCTPVSPFHDIYAFIITCLCPLYYSMAIEKRFIPSLVRLTASWESFVVGTTVREIARFERHWTEDFRRFAAVARAPVALVSYTHAMTRHATPLAKTIGWFQSQQGNTCYDSRNFGTAYLKSNNTSNKRIYYRPKS